MLFYGLTVNRSQRAAILTEAAIDASWFTEIHFVNSECYNTETGENHEARNLAGLLSFILHHNVGYVCVYSPSSQDEIHYRPVFLHTTFRDLQKP